MRPTQFEILQQDLATALLQTSHTELMQRRGFVHVVLEEYGDSDNPHNCQVSLVNYLNTQLSEHTHRDRALFNLILAELIAEKTNKNSQRNNLSLVNSAIQAINYWKNYREKHELAENRRKAEKRTRNRNTAERLNEVKHEPLKKLVTRIFELYKPTIETLHDAGKPVTYLNIARRIEPQVREYNLQPSGRYLLGGEKDPVGAIKRRLEKAVREKNLKSTREYKKH